MEFPGVPISPAHASQWQATVACSLPLSLFLHLHAGVYYEENMVKNEYPKDITS